MHTQQLQVAIRRTCKGRFHTGIRSSDFLWHESTLYLLARTQKIQNILGMIFAWCTLWGVHMFVRETQVFQELLGQECSTKLAELEGPNVEVVNA